MNLKKDNIIGIDFGLKRIGLAVCSNGVTFAVPSKTIEAKKDDLSTVKHLLESVSGTIDRFVLGLPVFLDGKESDMTKRVRVFAKVLEETTGKPVHFMDERLTSEESENILKEMGKNRKERIPHKDALSAQIILKDFLHSHQSY